MHDDLFKFCKQIKDGGIEGLSDYVCKDLVHSAFDEKIYEQCYRARAPSQSQTGITDIPWSVLAKYQEADGHSFRCT